MVARMFEISQLRIFTEPQQGATYDDLLAVASTAERLGFGAFFRSDHYLAMGGALEAGGLPGPTDAWITLAGLARDTSTIRLGTLVTSATFRLPGPLACQRGRASTRCRAAASSSASAPAGTSASTRPTASRSRRSASASTVSRSSSSVLTGFWSTPVGERFDHRRRRLARQPTRRRCPSRCRPAACRSSSAAAGRSGHRRWRPASPPSSTRRSSRIERFVEQRQRVRDACAAIGRDPDELIYSAALVACVGDDEADGRARRAASIGRDPAELRANGVAGTVAEARATLERWQEAGAERIYLQVLDLSDLDHLETPGHPFAR